MTQLFIRLRSWFSALFGMSEKNDDLDQEFAQHIELEIEGYESQGLSPEEAHTEALKEFGNVESLKEECRDAWGIRVYFSMTRNLRFGLRLLRKNLNTSMMAISVLTIGIGLAVTMFTFVNGLLLSDIGSEDSDQIVYLEWNKFKGVHSGNVRINVRDFRVLRNEVKAFEKLAAYQLFAPTFELTSGEGFAERHNAARVSSSFFEMFGINPVLGRTFTLEEAMTEATDVVVISHEIWMKQFDGARSALGTSVLVEGVSHTIVGIMPPKFKFPSTQDIWIPSEWHQTDAMSRSDLPGLGVIGQLREGISPDQLIAEMNTIAGSLAMDFPDSNETLLGIGAKPYVEQFVPRGLRRMLWLLLFLAVLVLCVACVNVFNMILARTAKRNFELCVRSSHGASRLSLICQVLIDGFMITLIGAGLGLIIASIASSLLWKGMNSLPVNIPFWWHMNVDGVVITFVIGVVVATTLASSAIPAIRASRINSYEMLKDSSRTSSGVFIGFMSRFLVGAQIAVSVLILIVAVLTIDTGKEAVSVNFPFDADKVLLTSIDLNENIAFQTESSVSNFLDNLKTEMEASPGVEKVAYSSAKDGMFSNNQKFEIEGIQYEDIQFMPESGLNILSADAFEILGLNALWGRLFHSLDVIDSQKVCVVGEYFVKKHFKDIDPIGRQIRFKSGILEGEEWLTIVGIINRQNRHQQIGILSRKAGVYVPHAQWPQSKMSLLVKGQGDVFKFVKPLRLAIRRLAPGLAMPKRYYTVQGFVNEENSVINAVMAFLFLFGFAGLYMASVGLYAIIAFFAKARSREFGIRMALGASSGNIVGNVFRTGLFQVGVGTVFGLVGGLVVSRLSLTVFNFGNYQSFEYARISLVLVAVIAFCFIAMGFPALRVLKNDPMRALRLE